MQHIHMSDSFQISVRSTWANREIIMEIRTSKVTCSDLSVVWRTNWEEVNYGGYFLDIEMKETQHHKYPFSIYFPLNIALQLHSQIQTVIFAVNNYRKCHLVSKSSDAIHIYTSDYMCDVTATGTSELRSRTLASENPSICDIKVL